ncbi:hypothetical protein MMPV_009963 [Pyropia vietnamensis]
MTMSGEGEVLWAAVEAARAAATREVAAAVCAAGAADGRAATAAAAVAPGGELGTAGTLVRPRPPSSLAPPPPPLPLPLDLTTVAHSTVLTDRRSAFQAFAVGAKSPAAATAFRVALLVAYPKTQSASHNCLAWVGPAAAATAVTTNATAAAAVAEEADEDGERGAGARMLAVMRATLQRGQGGGGSSRGSGGGGGGGGGGCGGVAVVVSRWWGAPTSGRCGSATLAPSRARRAGCTSTAWGGLKGG